MPSQKYAREIAVEFWKKFLNDLPENKFKFVFLNEDACNLKVEEEKH